MIDPQRHRRAIRNAVPSPTRRRGSGALAIVRVIATPSRWRRGGGALVLLAAANAAAASDWTPLRDACARQTLHALSEAGLLPAGEGVSLAAQACRAWPYDPSLTLAAVAYPLPGSDAVGERALRLVVAVLGTADAQVHAVHETSLEEDAAFALIEGGLRLDTARYDLAEGVRAFGVVVRSSAPGASCPDARANDELTLYVRDGAALRPVFSSNLVLWARVEGEPCSWSRGQYVVTDNAKLTIAIENTAHHGFADLRVQADVTRTHTVVGSDREDTSRRRASRVLRYDGTRYDQTALENGFFWTQEPSDE